MTWVRVVFIFYFLLACSSVVISDHRWNNHIVPPSAAYRKVCSWDLRNENAVTIQFLKRDFCWMVCWVSCIYHLTFKGYSTAWTFWKTGVVWYTQPQSGVKKQHLQRACRFVNLVLGDYQTKMQVEKSLEQLFHTPCSSFSKIKFQSFLACLVNLLTLSLLQNFAFMGWRVSVLRVFRICKLLQEYGSIAACSWCSACRGLTVHAATSDKKFQIKETGIWHTGLLCCLARSRTVCCNWSVAHQCRGLHICLLMWNNGHNDDAAAIKLCRWFCLRELLKTFLPRDGIRFDLHKGVL